MAEPQASIEQRIAASMAPAEAPAEMPAEQPAEAPVEALAEAPEAEPIEAEGPGEVEGDDADDDELETAASADEPDEGSSDAAPEADVTLSSLSDLASHLGIEMGDLYSLSIPVTTADGERTEVSLSEWKDSYQHSQRAERASREAQELRETLEAEKQRLTDEFERQQHEAASYLNAAERQLMADFERVNWDELQANDPARWAAQRQAFAERKQELAGIRQNAAQGYDQRKAQMAEVYQQELSQLVEREQNAMLAAIPEWGSEEKRGAEQAKLREYLLDAGYSGEEIDQAYDHRAVVMARKAMLFDESQKQASAATKKVVKIGKNVLKPGAKQSKAETKQNQESAMRARLRKSGHVDDAAALIQHRLGR